MIGFRCASVNDMPFNLDGTSPVQKYVGEWMDIQLSLGLADTRCWKAYEPIEIESSTYTTVPTAKGHLEIETIVTENSIRLKKATFEDNFGTHNLTFRKKDPLTNGYITLSFQIEITCSTSTLSIVPASGQIREITAGAPAIVLPAFFSIPVCPLTLVDVTVQPVTGVTTTYDQASDQLEIQVDANAPAQSNIQLTYRFEIGS